MPDSRRARPSRRRISRPGEIFVSHNHIAVLNGLLDRPDGAVSSSADLCRAARPYLKLFGSTINDWSVTYRAWKMPRAWVETQKIGHRRIWQLTTQGRAIASGQVPSRIKGYGPYRGLREVRDRITAPRRVERIETRWQEAFKEESFQPVAQEVIELFRIWTIRTAPSFVGMALSMKHQWLRARVWAFLRDYSVRYRTAPDGVYNLSPDRRVKELVIDFAALREVR